MRLRHRSVCSFWNCTKPHWKEGEERKGLGLHQSREKWKGETWITDTSVNIKTCVSFHFFLQSVCMHLQKKGRIKRLHYVETESVDRGEECSLFRLRIGDTDLPMRSLSTQWQEDRRSEKWAKECVCFVCFLSRPVCPPTHSLCNWIETSTI